MSTARTSPGNWRVGGRPVGLINNASALRPRRETTSCISFVETDASPQTSELCMSPTPPKCDIRREEKPARPESLTLQNCDYYIRTTVRAGVVASWQCSSFGEPASITGDGWGDACAENEMFSRFLQHYVLEQCFQSEIPKTYSLGLQIFWIGNFFFPQ
ncbi:hypothetical protein ANN_20252 [Periplaneta americana]|uniref:Uncharacterized protein n=1 Tax=Periplaneta americana TaxID=6978 RepID=A0ABQ8SC56_PERAM|nr:hypothetical protein ANN_20252 [Periplaneta americana]